ncbi:MAG: enoyl-ACP reductase [Candidatus Hydrogenedentota bacterium]
MAKLLEGKRGIITGVANERSIAWGCAKACAEQGAELIFTYLGDAQEKRVRKLLEGLPSATCHPCDVTSDDDITAFFGEVKNRWDSLDFLVHSIAFADKDDLSGRFLNTSRDNYHMAIDISAYSLLGLAREAEALMTNGGSIVAMTYYGAEKVMPHYNIMGVAKSTLEATAKYLAADLGPASIRVNCVSAGPVRTLSSAAISGFKMMLRKTADNAPLRRNISQDEVAQSTLYLLSDMSSGVTGEVHHVDSGYNILGMFAGEEF